MENFEWILWRNVTRMVQNETQNARKRCHMDAQRVSREGRGSLRGLWVARGGSRETRGRTSERFGFHFGSISSSFARTVGNMNAVCTYICSRPPRGGCCGCGWQMGTQKYVLIQLLTEPAQYLVRGNCDAEYHKVAMRQRSSANACC